MIKGMSQDMLISVITPFYGNADIKRLEIVKQSIDLQRDISIELIVSNSDGITSPITLPKVINKGIKNSNGPFLYVSDSDVFFPSQYYFSSLLNLIKKGKELVFKRPPMRRLLIEDFFTSYNLVQDEGYKKTVNNLNFSEDYIVKLDDRPKNIKVFKKSENGRIKTFIASEEDFISYLSESSNVGKEPKYFNQERHCGGTFLRKEHALEVGNYCEDFISWGCWDADFQWKLAETFDLEQIPYKSDYEVIHMDHPKGYFDKPKWDLDKNLQNDRRKLGAKKCILNDRN